VVKYTGSSLIDDDDSFEDRNNSAEKVPELRMRQKRTNKWECLGLARDTSELHTTLSVFRSVECGPLEYAIIERSFLFIFVK
jgi:hypothetical protein